MRSLLVGVLAGLFCCGAQRTDCRAGFGTSDIERWREHLSLEAGNGFSGSVLVADGSHVIFTGEYGSVARDSLLTAYWIASISKVVTAMAILRLAEEGRVTLDAPLSSYLPAVPSQWEDVTIHHLLAHRSGFPISYAADGIANRAEALRALLDQQPVKPLGEFEYSNDGYNVLAIMIEIASGESFESYVRSRIFQPAGMEHSGFWGFEPEPSPVASPARAGLADRMRATIWRDGRSVANWGYRGATGIWSTPEDLHRLLLALREGRILTASSFVEMITSKNPAVRPDATTYGYGMALRLEGGHLAEYWHGGNEDWLGHNGIAKVVGDRTYVVLTNSGDFGEESWAHRIEEGLRACADPVAE